MDRIPTSRGNLSPLELMGELLYISYATQVDAGMSHERAAKLFGLDSDNARKFRHFYIFGEFQTINQN